MRHVYWVLSGPKMSLGPNLKKTKECGICAEDVLIMHYYAFVHSASLAPSGTDKAPAHVFCKDCATKHIKDTCPLCRLDGRCVRIYFPF